MKRFRYDIIGISEVWWTGKVETPNGDFIWSGEETSHMRGVLWKKNGALQNYFEFCSVYGTHL
jgi:hypothetical protein